VSTEPKWDPGNYLEMIRREVPGFDRLQEATVGAVPFPPGRVLDLGIGTGETSRRLLEAYPDAKITGLDSSPDMVFRAREMGIEVRLARMEDPLPDGPWDLVVAVLSVHHLTSEQKQDLFRRVREHSKAFVLADVVEADEHVTTVNPDRDHPESADDLADWCGGEVVWAADDLRVVLAEY
jgi:tRNA (cmo5U34)-methyltransferase